MASITRLFTLYLKQAEMKALLDREFGTDYTVTVRQNKFLYSVCPENNDPVLMSIAYTDIGRLHGDLCRKGIDTGKRHS
jgi:hypothetical protein